MARGGLRLNGRHTVAGEDPKPRNSDVTEVRRGLGEEPSIFASEWFRMDRRVVSGCH